MQGAQLEYFNWNKSRVKGNHVNDCDFLAGVLLHRGVLVLDFYVRVATNREYNTFAKEDLSL